MHKPLSSSWLALGLGLLLWAGTLAAADRFGEALQLVEQGQYEKAIPILRQLVLEYPQKPEPLNNLAVALAAIGRMEEADKLLQQALATTPSFKAIHENLSRLYAWKAAQAYKAALGSEADTSSSGESKPNLNAINGFHLDPVVKAPAIAPVPLDESSIKISVSKLLELWRQSWSEQRTAEYINTYASDYTPHPSVPHQAWKTQRMLRLRKPEYIELRLDQLNIQAITAQFALASFRQYYASDSYTDAVRKVLTLEKLQGEWRITRELVQQ